MRQFVLIAMAIVLTACPNIRFVSAYDEVIDTGVTEFAEELNTFVKNMGDLGGTKEGTFQKNLQTYNALDSKLDVLIARASMASENEDCKLEQKVYERIKMLLKDNAPTELTSGTSARASNLDKCNERLLVLVKRQLASIREIHEKADKCGSKQISCIRPATAQTALKIANQSINAVSVVEAAKKRM